MMETLSLSVLQRRLKRTSWLPLIIIAATLLGAMAFVLKRQFDDNLNATRSALGDVIESQKELLGQEVLLNQPQALDLRLQSILGNWAKKYPGANACVSVTFHDPSGAAHTMEKCGADDVSPREVFGKVPPTVTSVGTGKENIAVIRYAVYRATQLGDLFPPVLLVSLLLALIAAAVSHYLLVKRVERTVLNPLLEKISADQRNAAVAETARMLAHDVRRPFQTVRLALKSMIDSPNDEVRAIGNEICADVEGSIRSVNAMLQDVLDSSRGITVHAEEISLKTALGGAVESVLRLHEEARITTIQGYAHDKLAVGDREKIARVMTNLVENAAQAMNGRGTIEIRTENVISDKKPYIRVSVINDGPAIAPEDLKNLFGPFFTRRTGGTGLGLWIAKKIVEAHGAKIGCSSSEGRTEFWFTIPASDRSESELSKAEGGTGLAPYIEQSILVFDDERIVHSHWRIYAARHNYHGVCHFNSWEDFVAQDAFALARDCVAFVDIQFKNSKCNGMDIARSLRQLGAKRIYAITSAPEIARNSGLFDDVFGKEVPRDFAALIA